MKASLPCVCCFADGHRSLVKQTRISVNGRQDGFVCVFEVEQVFKNENSTQSDFRYLFPIDSKCCLFDSTFKIGDEVIKPTIQAKSTAKDTFDEAISTGHSAVIGEYLSDSLCEFKIGLLPPNTECFSSFKFVQEARLVNGQAIFTFPLRMISNVRGDTIPLFSNLSDSAAFEIEFCSDRIPHPPKEQEELIFETELPTESFSISKGDFSAVTILNSFTTTTSSSPSSTGPGDESNSDFIFVIDCSGSMSGKPIGLAREAMEFFLRSLPPGCRFNIMRFGSSFETFSASPVEYTNDTVTEALSYISSTSASLGGTELFRPLEHIFGTWQPEDGRVLQIFILTDGEVQDRSSVLSCVGKNRHFCRIFTLGIGSDVDRQLVEGIADKTMGRSDFAREPGTMSEKVLNQLESAETPGLTNLDIHVEGDESVEFSPFPLPPIFRGIPLTAIVKTRQREFLVSGKYCNEDVDISISSHESILDESIFRALFSFQLIHDLEWRDDEETKAKIISLSISSGILSKHTAFVGVSENVQPPPPQFGFRSGGGRGGGMMRCCAPMSFCACAPSQPMGFASAPRSKCCGAPAHAPAPGAGSTFGGPVPMANNTAAFKGSFGNSSPSDLFSSYGAAPQSDQSVPPSAVFYGGFQADTLEMKSSPVPAPSPSPVPVPISQKSSPPIFESLIRQQNIEGFWTSVSEVSSAGSIESSSISFTIPEEKVQATILALSILRKKCQSNFTLWRLIEKKALSWLSKNLPAGTDIESLISSVIASI